MKSDTRTSDGNTFLRTTLLPLFLMLVSPPGVQFVWVVCYHYSGNALSALTDSPTNIWSNFPSSSIRGALLAFGFLFTQLLLLLCVPGSRFVAIPTPMGNRPEYKLNGVACFFITHAAFAAAAYAGWIRYGFLYDHFGELLAFLNQSALVATVMLYFRGIYFPTNSDSGTTGYGFVWDMWHGTELHPEIFGVSLKQLINCRFALMGWSVAVVAFACKQCELYGSVANSTVVSVFLQTVYIFKFFVWEGGYFNSVDIIHDRFGFYIFWGCFAFLPSIYTLTSYYLTTHPIVWDNRVAIAIAAIGVTALCCNYWTDRQREVFRAANGDVKIWGKKPVIIEAQYVTGDGKNRRSLLLASGWWGVSRHINYVFEITLAFCWSVPAATSGIIPYVYVIFLTILLTDRAYRDEIRCSEKYGKYYEEYCRIVPWKMIPGVY